MNLLTQLNLLASYNTGLNRQLYTVAAQLPQTVLEENRGAFFGSILGSFNHIVVADLVWLRRFATMGKGYAELTNALKRFPIPEHLDEILFQEFGVLTQEREHLDQVIEQWTATIRESDLAQALAYHNMRGVPHGKSFYSVLLHFFTHQIHHRGQITTLFSQLGLDFGETDFLLFIPEQAV